jgi:hypothetical protein
LNKLKKSGWKFKLYFFLSLFIALFVLILGVS